MEGKGYREISDTEYVQINQQAMYQQRQALDALMKPVDIVAYDVRTKDIFVGKSKYNVPPSNAAEAIVTSIEVRGITTDTSCAGFAELTKMVPGGKGSLGKSELLCRDGRKIKGEFVYDSLSSGYGRGVDSSGNAYLFLFGDLNLDTETLRTRFEETLEKEKKQRGEKRI